MIVIANKTETRLREDLRKFVAHKPSHRCFHLEFSRTDVPKGPLFETFLRQLETVPHSYMARVYLCDDKDILILLEGFMQRHFLDFVTRLATELKEKDFSNLVDIINIFQLGTDWPKLEKLYTEKIEKINKASEQEAEVKRLEKSIENIAEVMVELDPDQVSTLNARRKKRAEAKVMIADDDPLSRTLAGNVLRPDYRLAFAKNGSEALNEYIESAPDILFLDIGMPDIGGHEVLESLFQIDPHAYIIMFSGRKDKGTIMKSLNIGAQGFLGKPFTRDQLYLHVENSPFVQSKKSAGQSECVYS